MNDGRQSRAAILATPCAALPAELDSLVRPTRLMATVKKD